jgi:hypothetical protein
LTEKRANCQNPAGGLITMPEQDVLSNQKLIIENQALILANQKTILANQDAIRKNQQTLDLIVKNQEKILGLLQK